MFKLLREFECQFDKQVLTFDPQNVRFSWFKLSADLNGSQRQSLIRISSEAESG